MRRAALSMLVFLMLSGSAAVWAAGQMKPEVKGVESKVGRHVVVGLEVQVQTLREKGLGHEMA